MRLTIGIAPSLITLCLVATAQAEGPTQSNFPPPSPELIAVPARAERPRGMHPPITLLDNLGQPVRDSSGLVSFIRTCGNCHDAAWIGQHGYHFQVGANERVSAGTSASGRAWDFGPGLFGRWDPLAGYDSVLVPEEDSAKAIDGWVDANRSRLAGGGPATLGDRSRGFEPNCGICHLRGARIPSDVRWPAAAISTATLLPLGIVELSLDANAHVEVSWRGEAFLPNSTIDSTKFVIQSPSSEACGQCHGIAHKRAPELSDWGPGSRTTETTGQLFLPSRISESTLNVQGRDYLVRPWDVHAERMVTCANCHFSPNDPRAAWRNRSSMPEHLRHEVRSVSLGEFLRRPDHNFAKGYSNEGQVANATDGTMRRCEDCHDALRVHRWLPKAERHLEQVGCETCHLDAIHAPARRVTDYSVIDAAGRPRVEYRGIEGVMTDPAARLSEFRPLLLRRKEPNGRYRLLPYNVITTFHWVVETPQGTRPAPIELLRRALFDDGRAVPVLLAQLDRNHDGSLDDDERVLSTVADVALVRRLLVAVGAKNPVLVSELQPFGIHHGMAPARFALRNCDDCHSTGSRLAAPFELAKNAPYGVLPRLLSDSNVVAAFRVERVNSNGLILLPEVSNAKLHVFGLNRQRWVDVFGLLTLGAVAVGVLGHAAMRLLSNRRRNGSS